MFKHKKQPTGSASRPGHRSKKRKFHGNRFSNENETEFASTSARKLSTSNAFEVEYSPMISFCILCFSFVFSELEKVLICRICKGDISFSKVDEQGFGFKLKVTCQCHESVMINSCPKVNNRSYSINRRIVYIFRLMGNGLSDINLFAGLMDIGRGMSSTAYYAAVENIYNASKAVYDIVIKKAGQEEKELSTNKEGLTVSGDGSWSRRGFSSLFGVITLIGHYSNKVVDLIVKSSFCQACILWKKKKNTTEYDNWYSGHEENCAINHAGSAGKMEVDGMLEMFGRAEELHGVPYKVYIGDGDTKTFKSLLQQDKTLKKKECVNHVQKRMGSRLRAAKTKFKNLGGRGDGKLTLQAIKDLTTYFGLAIRRHPDSAKLMQKEILATLDHKTSTDKNPKHDRCPEGHESWCKYRRAEAAGDASTFQHPPPFTAEVEDVLRPIYEDLSSMDLLERCVGGFTQNNNESFNKTVWHFCPKHMFSSAKIIEIGSFNAACIFNEGAKTILKIMEVMGISIGTYAHNYALTRDERRLSEAKRFTEYESREERMARKNEKLAEQQFFEESEGLVYGPGIAD